MITLKKQLAIHRSLLHRLQLHAEVTMNSDEVRKIIGLICDWSYAHRCGNGELSEKEQQKLIDSALLKIEDYLEK